MTRASKGFTLMELMVTVSIIGVLSTVGSVSYNSVRARSRDTKRVSDIKQLQVAVEFFFENNSYYPLDGVPGSSGMALGGPTTSTLSDAGFSPERRGILYMAAVPSNPEPGGSAYIYRSLHRDGGNCDVGLCDAYALLFTLEKDQGSLLAGPHAITPTGTTGAEGGFGGAGVATSAGTVVGIESLPEIFENFAKETADSLARTADDPDIERAAELAVAPAATVISVANSAAIAQSVGQASQYFLWFISQPLLLFKRRRRQAWGVAYNALSKLPEDLVIVRLKNAVNGKIVQSAVTDAHGRFAFLAQPGRYRIEIAKAGLVFPSQLMTGKKEDGRYLDLYHGDEVAVAEGGALLTPNIPLDPSGDAKPDDAIIKENAKRRFQESLALASPALGAVSLTVRPSALVAVLFIGQLLAFFFFRRLATKSRPKSWGVVYDEASGRPLIKAVVRIFALPYHKLLESQITDRRGRYSFRVGSNMYYLTVTKKGYLKTESDPLDLTAVTEPTAIASDLPLRKEGPGWKV
ncbi:prepilin-type N-terminal cleavage/methylation domain-containing protein [Candidatus Uhrbacteria bacterium]|nr:prepilin-type N-terminal cleavage/methylation domain-containing protein [Candidatus Uhrbacteria bacterium]